MPKTLFEDRAVDTVLSVAIDGVAASPNLDVGTVANWPVPAGGEEAIALVGFGTANVEPIRYTGVDAVNGILTGTSRIAGLMVAHGANERVVHGGDASFLEQLLRSDLAQRLTKRLAIDPDDGVVGAPSILVDEATTNVITNPSFEVDTTGWTVASGTLTRDTAERFIGVASGRHSIPAGATNEWIFTDVAAGPGEVWTCSAWVKGTAGKTQAMALQFFDAANALITTVVGAAFTLSTGWQRIVRTATTPAGTAKIRVSLRKPSTADQGAFDVWWDAVQMERKSYATTYADGSLGPGYEWTGAPHASASTRTTGLKVLSAGRLGELAGLGRAQTFTEDQTIETGKHQAFGDWGAVVGGTDKNTILFVANARWDGANWVRTRADVDASRIYLADKRDFVFESASDAGATIGSVITWSEKFRITKDGTIKLSRMNLVDGRVESSRADGLYLQYNQPSGDVLITPAAGGTARILFGNAGSVDTNIYRGGANMLQTDDALRLMVTDTALALISGWTDRGIAFRNGSPEGAIGANIGSLCCDVYNGRLWVKQSGTGTVGWVQK